MKRRLLVCLVAFVLSNCAAVVTSSEFICPVDAGDASHRE